MACPYSRCLDTKHDNIIEIKIYHYTEKVSRSALEALCMKESPTWSKVEMTGVKFDTTTSSLTGLAAYLA